jgi:hypothetical protein
MNYSSAGGIEMGVEGLGGISKAEIELGGVGQLRTFRLHRVTTILLMAVIWCAAAWTQTEASQTIAAIPTEEGKLIVQNGKNNEVWLTAGSKRVSLGVEEALRVAAWIKEGKAGQYGDLGSVRFRRESRALVVTLVPKKKAGQELRLGETEALQLAAALASVRQNVSTAGQ